MTRWPSVGSSKHYFFSQFLVSVSCKRGWEKIEKHKIQALLEFIKLWYKMKTNKFCWEIFHEHFLWPFTRGNNKMPPWNSKRKLFVFTLSYFGEIIFRNLHVVCNMCWVYFRFIGLAFFKYHVFSECNKDTWNPIIWQVCHKNWFIELLLEFLQ